ncbi:MAG: DUF4924 family protein [Alistipes sp.]|nr:DUF4924 family protein [Alistipes sp.]
MLIALQKRKENIAEYILYIWQVEDLLRALQFSPEAIYSTLVAKVEGLDEQQKENIFNWYMQIVELLRKEGKEAKGHIDHTLHLIADMHNLHLQLMKLPVGEHYRATYAPLSAELPRLRMLLDDSELGDISDTELCFRALYATLLYRIKGGGESVISDTLAVISPAIGSLAAMYGKVERGEINLFDD